MICTRRPYKSASALTNIICGGGWPTPTNPPFVAMILVGAAGQTVAMDALEPPLMNHRGVVNTPSKLQT